MSRVVIICDGKPESIQSFATEDQASAFIKGFHCATDHVSADSLAAVHYDEYVEAWPEVDLSNVPTRE